jgi:N6-L-threonylcarbamoyladenine synthase
VICMLSANQDLEHLPFGGVVPELASRNHTLSLLPLIDKLLKTSGYTEKNIDVLCVTNRPGLVGSLLVGLVTAKTLSILWKKPFVGVNHLVGHLLAPWLKDDSYSPTISLDDALPSLVLAVSGGHTHLCEMTSSGEYEILGQSIDDAAGEALDKFAKELGLGFPGGAKLDQWARRGDPMKYQFPKGLKNNGLNFSFSGTKASGLRMLEKMSQAEIESEIYNLCASFEKDVIDVLFEKLNHAFGLKKYKSVAITGGVSANTYLRQKAEVLSQELQVPVLIPPLKYCTDNAAMIGFAGLKAFIKGDHAAQDLAPYPRSLSSDFRYMTESHLSNNKP